MARVAFIAISMTLAVAAVGGGTVVASVVDHQPIACQLAGGGNSTTLTAVLLSLFVLVSFVGLFYVSPKSISELPRNHPRHVA